MLRIPINRSMQKSRITSRLFSEYIKSKLPDTTPKVLTTIGITAGITFLLTSYAPLKEISKDTGLDVAISDFSGPLFMKMIAGDLTRKLCETRTSITEFNNVGDGCDYVTRSSLEECILQASEQSLKNKGGV